MGEQSREQSVSDLAGPSLKIAIGVCSRGEWTSDTAVSVCNMVKHFTEGCADGEVELVSMSGFIVPEQRARIWAQAEAMKATHALFVDTDMGFPPDTLARLLTHGKAMVGANYPRKSFPYHPTAYVDNDDDTGPLYTTEESEGLALVQHIGFGLVLIDMQVFDALMATAPEDKPPLFHFEPNAKMTRWCTEDVYFCRRVGELGIDMFVDHDLSKEVYHVGSHAWRCSDSVVAKDSIRNTWAAGK